jgi:hypothetical protein
MEGKHDTADDKLNFQKKNFFQFFLPAGKNPSE